MKLKFVAGSIVTALSAAVLAGQQAAPAQEPPQEPPPVVFRVEVNYVEVDAVVTDAQGNAVKDLTADDFEILEDGKPQKVTAFSMVDLPIERRESPLFGPAGLEPDVQTNTTAEGRIYVIVLDDLHTSFTNSPRVRQGLHEFIEQHFGANDLAAVVYTSGRANDGQDFTSSRRLLLQAVDRFTGRKLRSEALEVADALGRPLPVSPSEALGSNMQLDPYEAERAHNARTTMSTIRRLAEFMSGVRGRRKAMLLVSEGISYDVSDPITNRSASVIMDETRDAVAAATRANVALYAIDPRGLYALDETIESAGSPQDVSPSRFSVNRRLAEAARLSQDSLRALADDTGGFAAVNRNDFAGAFERVVRENSAYYMLGYYSTNERRDGRFRRLEVRVKRPGLQVRSRRGYVAPRGRAPEPNATEPGGTLAAAAAEALGSPVPVSGLPLSVVATPYKGAAPNATVALAIEMRVDDFRFAEKDGSFTDTVDIRFSSVEARGTVHPGSRHTLRLAMKPDTMTAAKARGFRLISQMDLPPGRYQMRIAAAEEGAGKTGSVLYDLDVPDFYKPGLTMSGLSLTSVATSRTPTVVAKNPLADFLPAPPTAQREFERGDAIALFAEVYENGADATPHVVDLSTAMRADDGRVVFEHREERSSADLQGSAGGYGYNVEIPLADLAPGNYVIHVEGRSRANGAETGVGRDVLIRIR